MSGSTNRRFVRAAWTLLAFQLVAGAGATGVAIWAALKVQALIDQRDLLQERVAELEAHRQAPPPEPLAEPEPLPAPQQNTVVPVAAPDNRLAPAPVRNPPRRDTTLPNRNVVEPEATPLPPALPETPPGKPTAVPGPRPRQPAPLPPHLSFPLQPLHPRPPQPRRPTTLPPLQPGRIRRPTPNVPTATPPK
jgi:hypothetical protein